MFRSLSARVLLAIALGLAGGAALTAWGGPDVTVWTDPVEALGGLWLNGLRMTVIPLVFALLVTGIASVTDAAATGRLAARAIGLFAILLVVAAIYTTLATQGLLAVWPVDATGAQALRTGAGAAQQAAVEAPSFADFIRSLAPSNPIKAAAEDAILPLVVFAVFVGFAATRLPDRLRTPLVILFEAIAETMIVIVRWVLWVAPIGVFALSLGVGLRAGLGAAGALLQYVTVVSLVTAGIALLPYLMIALRRGGVGVGAFARAAAPVQALAFSTQSSLACLPAMIERANDDLRIPTRITGLVLPLAVAVFRLTSPVANLAVVYFVAHVYGIQPSLTQMLAAGFVALAVSVGSVGLPGQISFFVSVTPICIALGAPLELLPILLAVEVIPDIFRTIGNVTGDLGVAAMLKARGDEAVEVVDPTSAPA